MVAASGGAEKEDVLLSKLNSANCLVQEKRSPAPIAPLKALAQEADAVELKYLSAQATLSLAEALLNAHQYAAARNELETSLRTSEKLGLRPCSREATTCLLGPLSFQDVAAPPKRRPTMQLPDEFWKPFTRSQEATASSSARTCVPFPRHPSRNLKNPQFKAQALR